MKAAVVSDDLQTVSAHFGMARHYLVYEIEGGVVKGREVREKLAHGQGQHHHEHGAGGEPAFHDSVLSNIRDCDAVVSAGMGTPMYESIVASGKKAFITRVRSADEAAKALAESRLDNHPEFLH
ncbi:MAG: hypothetical protein JRM80_08810 [Nitrososphaerota archaeon]|nr:hypothetical protein [Nitrososphaerota archaeon]